MLLTDAFLLCGSHLVHGQVNPETIQSEWFIKGAVRGSGRGPGEGPGGEGCARRPRFLAARPRRLQGAEKSIRDVSGPRRGGRLAGLSRRPEARQGRPGRKGRGAQEDARGDGRPFGSGAYRRPGASSTTCSERSVQAFQRRHGLEPDGAVGAETATALNVPAAERLTQIRANLERWRWITQDLGERYILVNVADFRVASSKPAARSCPCRPSSEAPTGRRPTSAEGCPTSDQPALDRAAEAGPGGHPAQAAKRIRLPQGKGDPDLTRTGRKARRRSTPRPSTGRRSRPTAYPYKFRQDPGPHNSLGRIMFVFPNKFDVYMHDTPERGLFSRAVARF